jgi:hypothetical protein
MAAVKVKLATGTLTLQEHKAKFARKGEVSPLCPMCKQETEYSFIVVPTDLFHEDVVGGLTIKSWGEFRLYFCEISSNFENQLSEF